MRAYVIRRLLILIPTLLLTTLLIFFVVYLIPGDIADAIGAQMSDFEIDKAALRHAMGIDAPALVQYGRWMGFVPQMDGSFSGIFQGDLGASWWTKVSVVKLLVDRLPVTLELGLLGLIVAQLIALPVGIYSALRQDTAGDYIGRSFAILCISIPSFWLGTMIILFPSIWWGYMPPIMIVHFTEDPIGNLGMFIIPAIVLGMALGGMTMRMTRTMMLEVMGQDYIRTAWAKGLRERTIVLRHTLKNALIPVITIVGIQMPNLIGGAVIVEQIFCLSGLGRLALTALLYRDEPVIRGVTLIFAVALALINLMVDLTYAYLDPRVHYK
jgi:peptide/nickel transport system permease protein